jgi:hypothetical protein
VGSVGWGVIGCSDIVERRASAVIAGAAESAATGRFITISAAEQDR